MRWRGACNSIANSRDDVWPALRAQLAVWEAVHRGFTPMLPQHRGGQNPLQEALPAMSGFSWTQRTATPSCFALTSDAQSFLVWQAAQQPEPAYSEAASFSARSAPGDPLPKSLCRAPHFEDSDGDSGPAPELASSEPSGVAGYPDWQHDGPTEITTEVEQAAPSGNKPACDTIRFLISSSGIAHFSIFHSGSRMLCLSCHSDTCTFRCQPACGCFSDFTPAIELPSGARLCRCRACVIASAGDC